MKIEFLKQRAKEFLKTSKYHFKEKMYHLVAFDLEQALQLYLKYFLFLKTRHYPPTHSLTELFKLLGKAFGVEKEIKKLLKENFHVISDLEEAYISSRYLPAEFTREQVKAMAKFVSKTINFLKKLHEKNPR